MQKIFTNPCPCRFKCQRRSFSHWYCPLIVLFSFLLLSKAVAAPEVNGSEISWPDDGWYQVQSSTDYQTVCEGGTSCSVPAGSYIVINHSTGERFTGIVVTGGMMADVDEDSLAGNSSVSVSGTVIRWPNDGWYQVQDATNFQTVCEGGIECDAGPGRYTVINHTSGERFTNINVGEIADNTEEGSASDDLPSESEEENGLTVEAGVIRWPNDGWYQVQAASDFASICEGGMSCAVEPGTYKVINHSTGQRWEEIVVASGSDTVPGGEDTLPDDPGSASDPSTNPTATPAPQINDTTITFAPGGDWYQVLSVSDYTIVCETNLTGCIVATGIYDIVNLTTGERWNANAIGFNRLSVSGLTAARTSETQVTLSWNELDVPELPAGYNIAYGVYRDGSFIAGVADTEFTDNGADSGLSHTYTVRVTLPEPSDGAHSQVFVPAYAFNEGTGNRSIINSESALPIFKNAVSVINELAFNAFVEQLTDNFGVESSALPELETSSSVIEIGPFTPDFPYSLDVRPAFDNPEIVDVESGSRYACLEAGELIQYTRQSTNGIYTGTNYVVEDCKVNQASYFGTLGLRTGPRGEIPRVIYNNIGLQTDEGEIFFSGQQRRGSQSFTGQSFASEWRDSSLDSYLADSFQSIFSYNMKRQYNWFTDSARPFPFPVTPESISVAPRIFRASVEGSFIFLLENFDFVDVLVELYYNETINVPREPTEMLIPQLTRGPFNWGTGSVVITASDDSSMTITPVAFENQSFQVSLNTGDIITPVLWDDGYRILCDVEKDDCFDD